MGSVYAAYVCVCVDCGCMEGVVMYTTRCMSYVHRTCYVQLCIQLYLCMSRLQCIHTGICMYTTPYKHTHRMLLSSRVHVSGMWAQSRVVWTKQLVLWACLVLHSRCVWVSVIGCDRVGGWVGVGGCVGEREAVFDSRGVLCFNAVLFIMQHTHHHHPQHTHHIIIPGGLQPNPCIPSTTPPQCILCRGQQPHSVKQS